MKYLLRLIFEGIIVTIVAGILLAVILFGIFLLCEDRIKDFFWRLFNG